MNDDQYRQHCVKLFANFAESLDLRTNFLPDDDPLRELAQGFGSINGEGSDIYAQAGSLVCRLFTTYPDFVPSFPREVLWFLGGDCLHFMPDEEIDTFQQLDELRLQASAAGELFDFKTARAKLLKLQ